MKTIIIAVCVAFLTVGSYADYVEVKRASGTSTSYSRHSNNLYVCYSKRVKVIVSGEMYVSYHGCTRENIRCSRIGKVHFGKYPSSYKARNALYRCRNSRPRFVD